MRPATPTRFSRRTALLAGVLALALGACKGESLTPTEPVVEPAPAPPMDQEPVVLASATFASANGYRTVGSARLEDLGGDQVMRLDEDFETDRSGALDVRLCTRRRCGRDDLVLGPLRSFRGAQSYAVPGDGTAYDFVVIWCTAVELPFGTGRLE